ncbi:MAG: CBASS cGAMP-activated phospholipase [Sinimarinibacterium sp.]|jgi:patatin-like phospholipase/acyl hydrolase
MAKYRILALDGGGLRGLITARLLQRLNDDPVTAGWLDQADLIAGTSTGGILALGLAKGKSPGEICDLYIRKGRKIFDDSIWDDVRDLGKTIGADYSNKALRKELNAIFGSTRLKDLKKRVTIPTFDLDNEAPSAAERTWKPKIFHNFPGKDSDGQALAVDVAMYTSAAPTYFPSVDGYVDGGVYANNPTLVALAQAISQKIPANERASLDEVVLLSVGTGVNLTYIKGQSLNWGYAQWIKPLINILMDGVAGISDYQAAQLLGDRYARLQIVFDDDENIPLDGVRKIGRMDEIATNYPNLGTTRDWIRDHWM